MNDLKTIDELTIVIKFEIGQKLKSLKEHRAKLDLSENELLRIGKEENFISNLNNYMRESKKLFNAYLGKLPPAAVDLEESILGALMLETLELKTNLYTKTEGGQFIHVANKKQSALAEVRTFLQPEHFYDERHKLIYKAILELGNNPVDMRTVVDRLRKNGTIDQAGGAYYIAELTAKVSSGANIQYHARVVMEFAIKNQLRLLGHKLMIDGYDDTVDCFLLYNHAVDKMNEIQEWTKK